MYILILIGRTNVPLSNSSHESLGPVKVWAEIAGALPVKKLNFASFVYVFSED